MSHSTPQEITKWIRKTYQQSKDRVLIRTRHIEKDRIWRGISEYDVRKALEVGQVHSVRSRDNTVFWRGRDAEGRELELQCSMVNDGGKDTLIIQEAYQVRVGTAYDPAFDDDELKKRWLAEHPEYEELSDGKVQRKITVTKI